MRRWNGKANSLIAVPLSISSSEDAGIRCPVWLSAFWQLIWNIVLIILLSPAVKISRNGRRIYADSPAANGVKRISLGSMFIGTEKIHMSIVWCCQSHGVMNFHSRDSLGVSSFVIPELDKIYVRADAVHIGTPWFFQCLRYFSKKNLINCNLNMEIEHKSMNTDGSHWRLKRVGAELCSDLCSK